MAGWIVMMSTLVNSQKQIGERFKEHFKALFPVHGHCNATNHMTIDNFSTVGREDQEPGWNHQRINLHKDE